MSEMLIQSLNENVANERVSKKYPHIFMQTIGKETALVLPSLPKGDLPVLGEHGGVTRQIGSIRKSALEIDKLRKISEITYHISDTEFKELKTPIDIMEVLT